MNVGVIKKDDIGKLLEVLGQDYTLFCPVKDRTGVAWGKITPNGEICLASGNSTLSPKGFFFPQCEVLYTFEGEQLKEIPVVDGKIAIFGIRPCDARALSLLDRVFDATTSNFRDPNYLRRRESSLVISLACPEPQETCFCTSVGGGPSNPSGSDILAFELDNAYLFEGLSDKGRSALAAYSGLFRAPEAAEIAAKEQRAATAQSKVPRLNVDDPRKRLEGRFDAPFWDSVALRCLGCGTCTYLCPTCHCFDITDETEGETGRRIRTWDSCQYPLFTLHASGHNPRPARKQRMRQRILHKFSYSVDNFGETFCVGCGRCVRHCPVNLDLRETLESLMTLEG